MRSIKIFAIGVAALIIIVAISVLLPAFEPGIEALAAIAFVLAVALGFALHPRRDVFCVRTTVQAIDIDHNLLVEHDQLVVKVEPARLWLLFPPTFLAVAFLVSTAVNGILWRFSLLERLVSADYGFGVVWFRLLELPIFLIGGALWVWISEPRVFRNAYACSARSVTARDGRIYFEFIDQCGRYGGGEGIYFGLVRPPALARLVFYNVKKPEANRIGMGLLFHRPIILGRGLTDLDHQTVATHTFSVGTAP